jgi:tRNA (guanine-N7-)-methyltransferase
MTSRTFAPEYENPATRLPIQHPDYRYPASRNPYFEKVKQHPGRIYSDNATEEHRGSWRAQFLDASDHTDARERPARRELHVEIGCNGGHVILEWAARSRERAYMGLDWKFKQIFRGAEKAEKRGIRNLIFLRANSERLQYIFGPGEIDHLYLFFPDPWPRKSQWKNRFVSPERLRHAAEIVRPGGIFHIKTDHDGYFDWMLDAVKEVGDVWRVVESTRDLHAGHPDPSALTMPEVTLFERIFIKQGIRIKQMKLERL